jgi:hypothetical protein
MTEGASIAPEMMELARDLGENGFPINPRGQAEEHFPQS